MMVRAMVAMIALLMVAQVHGRDLAAALAPAERALAAQDYPTAWRAYQRHAATNPLAQFTLGLFEQQGWGRPPDQRAACTWFERAAHGQIPAAQQFLGDCLARGIGRAVDGPGAVQWYRRAAAMGLAYADCSAGTLYLEGAIVPRDVRQGLALCARAAQAESVPAMLVLAKYYETSSRALTRYWYDQAAQRHSHAAQFQLGVMLSEGDGGAANLDQARFWLEHAAMEGYAPAYLPTAILYANAPTNPDTGALAPDDLARVYMWSQAARASTTNPAQLAELTRIDGLVRAVMPGAWQPALDRRVAEHLARYRTSPSTP